VLPSIGMAANSHLGLVNTKKLLIINRDTSVNGFHRSTDHGAGAVSDHPTVSWTAMKAIQKGEEIFVDYGNGYFATREEKLGVIPFEDDFDEADSIVKRFFNVSKASNIDSAKLQELWDIIREIPKSRISHALPKDAALLSDASEKGTALSALPNAIRPVEWLQEHGQCIENLNIKPSTIRQAGRGAFASRYLPKGSIISPSPLIQIKNKKALDMYELRQESDGEEPKKVGDKVVGRQLLLNYCFGHQNSTLIFFPYATAVQVINHKSDYNAEIRWSKQAHHHADWLEIDIEDIPVKQTGLMIDYVAVRDILPGEEVFIDYGRKWEESWNEYVTEWKSPQRASEFVFPETMNASGEKVIRTVEEQIANPYPSNLQTTCFFYIKNIVKTEMEELSANTRTSWTEPWNDDFSVTEFDEFLWQCHILERYQVASESLYTVQIFGGTSRFSISEALNHVVTNVPRRAIKFSAGRYSGDDLLRDTFRHEIEFPEAMFPSKWMNNPAM